MQMIPTYRDWREELRAWCAERDSLQQAVEELSSRLARDGVQVSVWTLRYHARGDYEDVGLTLARGVARVVSSQKTPGRH